MKTFAALALLTTIFASSASFAGEGETVVVTAPREPGRGGTGGAGFPTPGSGTVHCEQRDCGKAVDDTGAGIVGRNKVGNLKKGDKIKDDLGAELGKIFSFLARDFDAAGEIWVKVETPTGYKIEVRITAQAKVTGKR